MVKRLSVFFLIFGIAGVVLFFPLNMNNRYTCLYHRLFCRTEPVAAGHDQRLEPHTNNHGGMPHQAMQGPQVNALIPHYLKHFAFYWWGSLLLAGICLFLSRKKSGPFQISDINEVQGNLTKTDENIFTG